MTTGLSGSGVNRLSRYGLHTLDSVINQVIIQKCDTSCYNT